MSKSVNEALDLWIEGQSLIEKALKQTENENIPESELFQQFSALQNKLRNKLRRVVASLDVDDPDAGLDVDSWSPWRVGSCPVGGQTGGSLEDICKLQTKHKTKIEWNKIDAWELKILAWFGSLGTVHNSDDEGERPNWNREKKTLTFNDETILSYSKLAPSGFDILDTFQLSNWKTRIECPLVGPAQHYRLVEINKLNKRLTSASPIKFRSDGTGSGIEWVMLEK